MYFSISIQGHQVNSKLSTQYGIYEGSDFFNDTVANKSCKNNFTAGVIDCPGDSPYSQRFSKPAKLRSADSMDALLDRYRDKLHQLNACIDQAGESPSICIKRAHNHIPTPTAAATNQTDPFLLESLYSNPPEELEMPPFTSECLKGDNNEVFCGSDYEAEAEVEEDEEGKEPNGSICSSDPIDMRPSEGNQTTLPESPSLDQLADE